MDFDGSLWGRRVQATGQTPVATAAGFVALFTLDNFQGTRNEIVNGGPNSALNGGGDIRVSTDDAGANQLPLEIVQFTVSATPSLQAIEFWVRFPTYEAANRAVWVFYNRAGQTQPPVTDAFGRNSVWQDLNRGFHGSNLRIDVSGNTVDGTFVGAESLGSDTDGSYTVLNGTNTYVTLPDSIGTQTSLTISAFIEVASLSGNGFIFAHGDFQNNSRLYFGLNSDEQFFTRIGTTSNQMPPSLTGKNVLTAVINAGQVTHYVNGVEVLPPSPFSGNAGSSLQNYTAIGAFSASNGTFNSVFSGRVYDLFLYQSAKNANDINLEYLNRASTSTFWTMGEPEDTGGGVGDTISPVGIFSGEVFGSAEVSVGGVVISPNTIDSLEFVPEPQVLSSGVLLSPLGIPPSEVVNLPTIQVGEYTLSPAGIGSGELLGSPLVSTGELQLLPTSIGSAEGFGVPALVYAQLVQVSGIQSKEVFGLHIVSDGQALVIPLGDRDTYQRIATYLKSTGRFVSEQNNDIIIEWLRSELLESGQFNDLFMEYWSRAGLTGAYNDRWKKWRS